MRSRNPAVEARIITAYNPGAEHLFGYAPAEAIGRPISLIIPDNRVDEERTFLARVRRGERIDSHRSVRRRKDGRLVDVSLTIPPILNRAGIVGGAAKIARRVTAPTRADELLRLALQAAPIATVMIDETGRIVSANVEAEQLLGRTPGLANADAWLKRFLAPLLEDRRFTQGTLVVITFDENDGAQGNQIYTAFVGPMVRPGIANGDRYTHYGLLKLIEDNFELGRRDREDATAKGICCVWRE